VQPLENPWQFRALRLARWLTPDRERCVSAEARLFAHGVTPGAIICSGRLQLTLVRGCSIRVGLRVNRVGPCINAGLTPTDLVTVLTVRRGAVLTLLGAEIGRGCRVLVDAGAQLAIGAGTYINDGSRIHAARQITIGERCAVAWNVTLLDDDEHGFGPGPYSAPVTIGDDVWIGCNVTILKGVTIGSGSVVAAGSVVTRSCPPRSLIGGSPARVLRSDVHWTDLARGRSHGVSDPAAASAGAPAVGSAVDGALRKPGLWPPTAAGRAEAPAPTPHPPRGPSESPAS
jgi:acetyltransferase-like isoleucine patch superfamily enzyme